MLTDAQLLELAGKAAFNRGRVYRDEDRIRLERYDDGALQGEALGSEVYPLWLKRADGQWCWSCACPAADGGALCKHLVAAVLVARDGAVADADADEADSTGDADGDDDTGGTDDDFHAASGGTSATRARGAGRARKKTSPASGRDDELFAFLRAQPAERLACWLREFADADADIDRRLHLYRAAGDPARLKPALAKLLSVGGFLDWRASLRFAQRLDAAVDLLRALCASDPDACRACCEYAIGRLFRLYERCDDSSGAIGDRVRELADLHARACAAAPPGKSLVKALFALQQKDDWGIVPLDRYWPALGADGQHAYGKLVAAELARLPAAPRQGERWGEPFAIRRRAEAYARCVGDFDLLQRVLRWDLSQPHDHLRVIASLREFGREREALAFAESAVKKFPRDQRLRSSLAECLRNAGLVEEAIEQCWRAFQMSPGESDWDALKRIAGRAWPDVRARALAAIGGDKPGDAPGNSSLRVRLLLHDKDVDAAVAVAQAREVWADTLRQLAEHIARERPEIAADFYLRVAREQAGDLRHSAYPKLAALLQRAARLAPQGAWRGEVAALRAAHARKPRLMALLDQAGL